MQVESRCRHAAWHGYLSVSDLWHVLSWSHCYTDCLEPLYTIVGSFQEFRSHFFTARWKAPEVQARVSAGFEPKGWCQTCHLVGDRSSGKAATSNNTTININITLVSGCKSCQLRGKAHTMPVKLAQITKSAHAKWGYGVQCGLVVINIAAKRHDKMTHYTRVMLRGEQCLLTSALHYLGMSYTSFTSEWK